MPAISRLLINEYAAGGLDVTSPWVDVADGSPPSDAATLHLLFDNPTATLQATITLYGSNVFPQTAAELATPRGFALANVAQLTPAITGITISNGVITFNNPAISAPTLHLWYSCPQLPRYVAARVVYTSGGAALATRWRMYFNANRIG